MLLTEEQYLVKWLSQYGAMTKRQLVRMLHTKSEPAAERIIGNLLRRHIAVRVGGGLFISLSPTYVPEQKMSQAVWVLTQFIQSIDPLDHYPTTHPSQIFFLKENIGYEIIVLEDGEQHLCRLLQPTEDTKYIIVLPDISMADSLPLPDAPCLFATVQHNGHDDAAVTFYTQEEI